MYFFLTNTTSGATIFVFKGHICGSVIAYLYDITYLISLPYLMHFF